MDTVIIYYILSYFTNYSLSLNNLHQTFRTCQNIHSVPDEIDALYQKTEVEDIQQKLLRIKTKMEDTEKAKKLLIKELNAQKEKAAESIRQQFRKKWKEYWTHLKRPH
jgi:hypothetical protein